MAVRQGNRRKRLGLQRLLALVALVAGIAWAYHALYGSSGSSAANAPHRMVGAQSGTQFAAANGVAQGGTSRRLAGATATTQSAGAARPTAAHDVHAAVALSTRTVPAGTPGTVVRSGNAARYGVPSAARIPLPTAGGDGRATMIAHLRVATPVVASPLKPLPASYLLRNDYQVYKTWNNCGPASLSMALSYFGIQESQAALGQVLRPYQNPNGDNDDKDVTLDALAGEARTLGLLAYSRPNGSIQLLKRFVANGMPVIAETTMTIADDIGHYRVVKGFDDTAGTILQDDSMQGHNIQFSYADFDAMWKKYNSEYLVLVPCSVAQVQFAVLLTESVNPQRRLTPPGKGTGEAAPGLPAAIGHGHGNAYPNARRARAKRGECADRACLGKSRSPAAQDRVGGRLMKPARDKNRKEEPDRISNKQSTAQMGAPLKRKIHSAIQLITGCMCSVEIEGLIDSEQCDAPTEIHSHPGGLTGAPAPAPSPP